MTYATLQREADSLELQARELREQAEQEHKKAVSKNISAWLGYSFDSSSGLTPEFAAFSLQMKKHLAKTLTGYELVSYSRGHFYFSAFLKNKETGKLVYVSCSDVRYFRDSWNDDLLIRTAKHDKDYTGGSNCSSTLAKLKEQADKLTS